MCSVCTGLREITSLVMRGGPPWTCASVKCSIQKENPLHTPSAAFQSLWPVEGLDPWNYIVSPKFVGAKGRTVGYGQSFSPERQLPLCLGCWASGDIGFSVLDTGQ